MRPSELFQLYVDAICGADEDVERRPGEPLPGFTQRDYALLWRLIFWPFLSSVVLICLIVIHAVAAA